ncbi:hypothetical protein Mycch_4648 [Mycolicibacterium chubuense NBB4]|uniref:Uncharacterized protein n=1 Tax=Mycolicibacterium chubuense (strain NBB4) TaxID=710421 RepID=I4BPZ3_MYCCN|nr:hypothetical protein [Mycolicibacterium chubuense]AFM19350.1 hypothetical protein Mycch_4648 [Mycolicibacterium chubuense NBB4]
MALEKHVGRVGALAVALGIGSAVAVMPGVAWAEPNNSGSAAASQNSGDSARGHGPLRHERARPAASTESAGSSESSEESSEATDRSAAKRRSHGSRRAPAAGTHAAQAEADGRTTSQAKEDTDDTTSSKSARPRKAALGLDEPARTPVSVPESRAHRISIKDVDPSPAGTGTDAVGVVSAAPEVPRTVKALFAPRATSHRPDAPEPPGASPLLWTMLAAARRQLGELRDAAAFTRIAATGCEVAPDASSTSTPGLATQPVVIGADGTIYQVTVEANATTGRLTGGTRVSIVGPDGRVLKTRTLFGAPTEASNAVARDDGSLLVTTYSPLLNRTFVSEIGPSGLVRPAGSASGNVLAPVSLAADGTAYVETRINPSFDLGHKLIRISPNNTTRVYSAFISPSPPVVAPDGSAYLLTQNLFSQATVLMAIGPDGTVRRTAPRSDVQVVGQPVIGTDGRGYWAVTYDNADGARVTDVYTFTGNSSTIRHIDGDVSTYRLVPAGDGVYVPVVNNAVGTTSIARIGATAIEISQPGIGYLIDPIDVTPDGTVYASVYDYVTKTYSVAVYRPDGSVTQTEIAGDIVQSGYPRPPTEGFPTPNPDNTGYVAYTSGGHSYLAVLSADGTITGTVALPDGTEVTRPVSFDADGRAYQVVETPGSADHAVSVVSASTGAVTATLPGYLVTGHDSLEFGPDGTGYLITVEGYATTLNPTYHIVSFDNTGTVVASLDVTGFLNRNPVDYRSQGYFNEPLTFGPDGTAYASFGVFSSDQDGGVYALTPAGATRILAINDPKTSLMPVIVDSAGTPYVTVTREDGDSYVTTVVPLTA